MKKNLSISRNLGWITSSGLFSVQRTEGVCHCPNSRQQMRCSRVDSVLPVPGVKALLPLSNVFVGIHNKTTVILATFPPERVHDATPSENHTSRVPSDTTQSPPYLGFGMTHPRATANNRRHIDRRVASRQEVTCLVSSSCEPAGGLYPSASVLFCQESRPYKKQPKAAWY